MQDFILIRDWMISGLGLRGNELLVFAVVYGASADGATIFARNAEYLAALLGTGKRNVEIFLSRLCDKGLLEKSKAGYSVSERFFADAKDSSQERRNEHKKIPSPSSPLSPTPPITSTTPTFKNTYRSTSNKDSFNSNSNEDINTNTNIKNNSTTQITKTLFSNCELNENCKAVIDHLNEKTHQHYRYGEPNLRGIRARLIEGFTVADCKTVIDKQAAQWTGTEWEKYLRPDTLFRPSKFEAYLNAKVEDKDPLSNLKKLLRDAEAEEEGGNPFDLS